MRDKTHAYHKLKDDVDEKTKSRRLQKLIDVFRKHQLEINQRELNAYHIVLVEGYEKKHKNKLLGRTDTNKICIFETKFKSDENIPKELSHDESFTEINKGDYVVVKIDQVTNNSLYGSPICKLKDSKRFLDFTSGNPYFYMKDN